MTNANMKLVVVDVPFEDKLELSQAHLDPGEFIVKRIVQLEKLYDELKSGVFFYNHSWVHWKLLTFGIRQTTIRRYDQSINVAKSNYC
jgi:hypothetical protein